jgi:hypothetical protein
MFCAADFHKDLERIVLAIAGFLVAGEKMNSLVNKN